jgi:hypothetical protein
MGKARQRGARLASKAHRRACLAKERASFPRRDTAGTRGGGYFRNVFISRRFSRQDGLDHHPYKGKPVDAKQIGRELACAICSKAACVGSARRSR